MLHRHAGDRGPYALYQREHVGLDLCREIARDIVTIERAQPALRAVMLGDLPQVLPERYLVSAVLSFPVALLRDDIVGLDKRIVIEDPFLDQEAEGGNSTSCPTSRASSVCS